MSNPKKGGQELLGGVSVTTTRNGWGSQVRHPSYAAFCRGARTEDFDFLRAQVESFEAPLEVSGLRDADIPFVGIFIRAPVSITFIFFLVAALRLGALLKGYRGTPPGGTRTPHRGHLPHPRLITPTSHT